MRRPAALVFAVLSVVALFGGAAVAQQPQQSPSNGQRPVVVTGKHNGKDPNQVICETEESTGSRIAAKRVCATRGEFEQRRLADRQAIEKAQTQVAMPGN